ncbi:hypothetical protein Cfor_11547 [Coptotermes formosanus]|jgi:transposase|uniref:Mos1 transposase HTH domain-containing protein n=1 Tax=Coptotermes formosanus TaxID=36987 RepID=A0A6L2PQK9_COPFO|nr:hypothetical protein Cfor_11547 [Coptotermes formosanus]
MQTAKKITVVSRLVYFKVEVRQQRVMLKAKNIRLAGIRRQVVEVQGEGAWSKGDVRKWYRLFKEGRIHVSDKERSGRPSLVTDDLKERLNARFRGDGRFTFSELNVQYSGRSES